jgi:prevent-host-death family protein
MAQAVRRSGVKQVPLSEVQDDLSRFLCEAESEEIVVTRNGKPAGVLIGFKSEQDWFDYQLENDCAFCAASNRDGRACETAAVSGSRRSSKKTYCINGRGNGGGMRSAVPPYLLQALEHHNHNPKN